MASLQLNAKAWRLGVSSALDACPPAPPAGSPARLQVQVPPFVQRGDAVVVDTAERTFVRRG